MVLLRIGVAAVALASMGCGAFNAADAACRRAEWTEEADAEAEPFTLEGMEAVNRFVVMVVDNNSSGYDGTLSADIAATWSGGNAGAAAATLDVVQGPDPQGETITLEVGDAEHWAFHTFRHQADLDEAQQLVFVRTDDSGGTVTVSWSAHLFLDGDTCSDPSDVSLRIE